MRLSLQAHVLRVKLHVLPIALTVRQLCPGSCDLFRAGQQGVRLTSGEEYKLLRLHDSSCVPLP